MGNSLVDFNIEQSSSSNIKNIKWTQKNTPDLNKPKKKKRKNTSPTNIIYSSTKTVPSAEKVFIIEENPKSKKKVIDKRFENSSLSNCKIEQGYSRPGR